MPAASCPHCGTETPPRAARCQSCGFVFFERRERRRLPLPGPAAVALAALAAAFIAGAALLLTRDETAAAPAPPPPVAQARAEHLLENQLANAGLDDTAAVSCTRAIRPGSATRCQVRYANRDTQLILVGLDGRGDLDITIPYPAQRRPGG